jgi:hypothetical protein
MHDLVSKFVFAMSQFLYTLRNTKLKLASVRESISSTAFPLQFFMTVKHSILSFCAKTIKEIYDDVELFMNMSRCNNTSSKSHIDIIIHY